MLETFETFLILFKIVHCFAFKIVHHCSILNHVEQLLNYFLAYTLAVATIAGIYADDLTFVAEERNTDLSTCL